MIEIRVQHADYEWSYEGVVSNMADALARAEEIARHIHHNEFVHVGGYTLRGKLATGQWPSEEPCRCRLEL